MLIKFNQKITVNASDIIRIFFQPDFVYVQTAVDEVIHIPGVTISHGNGQESVLTGKAISNISTGMNETCGGLPLGKIQDIAEAYLKKHKIK